MPEGRGFRSRVFGEVPYHLHPKVTEQEQRELFPEVYGILVELILREIPLSFQYGHVLSFLRAP